METDSIPFGLLTADEVGLGFSQVSPIVGDLHQCNFGATSPAPEMGPIMKQWFPVLFGKEATEENVWNRHSHHPTKSLVAVLTRLDIAIDYAPSTVVYRDFLRSYPMCQRRWLVPILASTIESGCVVRLLTYDYLHVQALQVMMSSRQLDPNQVFAEIYRKDRVEVHRPNQYGNFEDWPSDFMLEELTLAHQHLTNNMEARHA